MCKSIEIQIRRGNENGVGKTEITYEREKVKWAEFGGRIYKDPLVPQLHAMDMFTRKRTC